MIDTAISLIYQKFKKFRKSFKKAGTFSKKSASVDMCQAQCSANKGNIHHETDDFSPLAKMLPLQLAC